MAIMAGETCPNWARITMSGSPLFELARAGPQVSTRTSGTAYEK